MRTLPLVAALSAFTLVTAACGGSAPAGGSGDSSGEEGGTITIGSLHPLSGTFAGEGQQMEEAVALAVEEINAAGGISSMGGAKLAVVSGDTQGKPDVGQSEAQRLIQEGAVALVGTYQTAVSTNVAAVAERSRVPLVLDVTVADAILQQGYEYTFRIQPDASSMGTQGARYLREIADANGMTLEKVGYLHEQTDFGTSVQEAFTAEAEKLGFTVDPIISYDAANVADLTTEVTRVKAAGADVLAVTGYYRDGVVLADAVASVQPGVDLVLGVANGAFDVPQFPTDTGSDGAGFLDVNYHHDATKAETTAVTDAFQERTGEQMRTAAVLSYEAVRVIAAALEEAGSADPTELRAAIADVSLADTLLAFDGPVEFDDTGQNVNAIPIVMQVQGEEIRQVWPEQFVESDLQVG